MTSTCGSIIKRESRLSAVEVFFRLDKELLPNDDGEDPNFELLVTVGERNEGEETLEEALLRLLRLLELSTEDDGTFFVTASAGLIEVFFIVSDLTLSVDEDKRETGDAFFVSTRVTDARDFEVTEANDDLLLSGVLFLRGSETEGETFLPSAAPFSCFFNAALGFFSAKPPMLFLLCREATFELGLDWLRVDFDLLIPKLGAPTTSVFFLRDETVPEVLVTRVTAFAGFEELLALSAEATGESFVEDREFATPVSMARSVQTPINPGGQTEPSSKNFETLHQSAEPHSPRTSGRTAHAINRLAESTVKFKKENST